MGVLGNNPFLFGRFLCPFILVAVLVGAEVHCMAAVCGLSNHVCDGVAALRIGRGHIVDVGRIDNAVGVLIAGWVFYLFLR